MGIFCSPFVNRPKFSGVSLDAKTKTQRTGYLSVHQRISNSLLAGIQLSRLRDQLTYDIMTPNEVRDELELRSVSPFNSVWYDRVDAFQDNLTYSARSREIIRSFNDRAAAKAALADAPVAPAEGGK